VDVAKIKNFSSALGRLDRSVLASPPRSKEINMRAILAGAALTLLLTAGVAVGGPIHDAAQAGDEVAIQKLLDAGTDINERNGNGETALFAAALVYGRDKTMDYLLQRSADFTIRNNDGLTVLHAAALAGDGESVAYYFGSDGPGHWPIDLNDQDNELGVTPLMLAAEEGHGNVVAYMVFGGADTEITARDGTTALARAGKNARDEVVTILLRAGAVCQEIDPAWLADCKKRKAEMGL
jgi:ankyrin repeat protein